ncbi:hypothetical protein NPIL_243941 [Nephila pilipes]|uniref:Uncharacterized protein n=1 Tax=Nephila pilipes TaxID=299642 RepID=A0A8X6M973_NEPPI|nr:hypothetical protein NPIL_243941 [Nephila pilipes]
MIYAYAVDIRAARPLHRFDQHRIRWFEALFDTPRPRSKYGFSGHCKCDVDMEKMVQKVQNDKSRYPGQIRSRLPAGNKLRGLEFDETRSSETILFNPITRTSAKGPVNALGACLGIGLILPAPAAAVTAGTSAGNIDYAAARRPTKYPRCPVLGPQNYSRITVKPSGYHGTCQLLLGSPWTPSRNPFLRAPHFLAEQVCMLHIRKDLNEARWVFYLYFSSTHQQSPRQDKHQPYTCKPRMGGLPHIWALWTHLIPITLVVQRTSWRPDDPVAYVVLGAEWCVGIRSSRPYEPILPTYKTVRKVEFIKGVRD